ncbi:MAG: cyclase [Cyanothece sp. SIO1E1]|nr:cyclase [Cyanothece sp. SIO1E1]
MADGHISSEPALDPALLEDVKIEVEKLKGRCRRIFAKIQIPHPIEQVWKLLTDYEGLADFIPNLAKSRRLPHPAGGIRIEQVGTQCLLNFKFCARLILDMEEKFPDEIGFQMVEGDFKSFTGCWRLSPIDLQGQAGTELCYNLSLQPRLAMPVSFIERRLCHDLTLNLLAIRQHAMVLFGT